MAKINTLAAGLVLMLAAPAWSMPRVGGTVAVMSNADHADPLAVEAAESALGDRGFTILKDVAHAAYSAEVITIRTEVGTSVEKGRAGRALATGGAVSIPLSQGKSVNVPMLRTSLEIRLRRRGEQAVLWHGAAVTVRSAGARDGSAEQVAFALSRAALSAYPTQTKAPISIP